MAYYLKGLDNGYKYTKDNEMRIFQSAYTCFDKRVADSEKIIIDGKTYYFGTGNDCADVNKTSSETNMVCTLANIAMSGSSNYILCVNLPISQYKKQRDEFKNQVMNYNNHEIIYKDSKITYNIADVSVFPQGVCAVYSACPDLSEEKIIFDIGSQTINIALFEFNDNDKLVPTKYITIFNGILKLFESIINEINKRYDLSLSSDRARYLIYHDLIIDGNKVDISFVRDIIKDYVLGILAKFKTEFPYKTTTIYLAGGGAEILYPIFSKMPNCIKIPDAQFANAKGLYAKGKEIYAKYI